MVPIHPLYQNSLYLAIPLLQSRAATTVAAFPLVTRIFQPPASCVANPTPSQPLHHSPFPA
ncbi:hypothetical protein SESBI_28834 [Sesbania bispinosa]|nr:hypothetical protein SESBI_28834 [Sesbania bispinosa]